MRALRLRRFELTVADLERSERFYTEGLGFQTQERSALDPALAELLGAEAVRQVVLRRGEQVLALQAFRPAGAPYPAGAAACDQVFQHLALPVADMQAAYARLAELAPDAISQGGPQQLPARSGGVAAWKFRDPDGHPLELIWFPAGRDGGIDHSAITVADAERSLAFYRDQLGFRLGARQVNWGPEQDRLDGLQEVRVDVVALEPDTATPHLELLGYRSPPVRPGPRLQPRDIAATRLVLEVDGGDRAALTHDPDGHALLLIGPG